MRISSSNIPETNSNLSESGAAACGSEITAANEKMHTSYEQKNDHCKDGACEHKHDDNIKSGSDNVGDIADGIGMVEISDKDSRRAAISADKQRLSEEDKKSKESTDDIDNVDDLEKVNIDDILFLDPPPKEDCPICTLPIPHSNALCGVHYAYQPCCGKILCHGCMVAADDEMEKGKMKACCPFCRESLPVCDKEFIKRCRKRMKLNDSEAFHVMGQKYSVGGWGLSKDMNKALELWHRAAGLGLCKAHYNLSIAYLHGDGVGEDDEKFVLHIKIAAIGGHEGARYMLGVVERGIACEIAVEEHDGAEHNNGRMDRAMKHFMIGARAGEERCLKEVGVGYKAGFVTKDDYANTLRAHQTIINEMKSEQRTKAQQR